MEYQYPDYPYEYNEEAGDRDNRISPGTKFQDLQLAGFVLSVVQRKQISNTKNEIILQA